MTARLTVRERALLLCGVAVCPLFYSVVIAQLLLRSGFDITRHPISLLSLGDEGWIQIANFMLTGLLGFCCAAGMRAALAEGPGRLSAPILVGGFGLGMTIAGVFLPDGLLGFPRGAPLGIPARMSGHAMLHGVGFFIAFASLTAACFVLARRYRALREPRMRHWSTATGILTPLLITAGMAIQRITSVAFFVVGVIALGWLGAVSLHSARSWRSAEP